jgi:hypothetical protein
VHAGGTRGVDEVRLLPGKVGSRRCRERGELDAVEGRGQRPRVVEIALDDLDVWAEHVGGLARVTGEHAQWASAAEEVLDEVGADVAGRADHQNRGG